MRRRGFTLVEVVLAAALGVIVAGAVFGVFAMIQRADESSRVRTRSIDSMSRLHRAMQRTCRTLLLDLPVPKTGAPHADAAGGGGKEAQHPRVALTETGDGLQRLEVSLSQAPLLGLVNGKPVDPVSRFMPVRGVFEIREDLNPRTRAREAYAVWWVPFQTGTDLPIDGGAVKVADAIEKIDINFAKTVDKRLEHIRSSSFADWAQVPAYVEVELTMLSGEKARWMFEVSGTTGSEIAAQTADADMPAGLRQRFGGVALASAAGTGSSSTKPAGESAGTASGSGDGSTPGTTGGGNTGGTTGPRPLSREEMRLISESIRRFYELLRQRDGGDE